MFLFGAPNVQKLSAKRDVQGLIKALGYEKDEQIRHAAALALGQIGDPRA
jgi:HEAT repeat protein